MRLKLILIASLLAAIVGSSVTIVLGVLAFSAPSMLILSTFILPVITTLLASIFVYRHTARRRKLQAILTAMLTIVLCLATYILASMVTSRSAPQLRPVTLPRNVS